MDKRSSFIRSYISVEESARVEASDLAESEREGNQPTRVYDVRLSLGAYD